MRKSMETVRLNVTDQCKGVTDEVGRNYAADARGEVTIPSYTAQRLRESQAVTTPGRSFGGVSLPGSKTRWERQREERERFQGLDN